MYFSNFVQENFYYIIIATIILILVGSYILGGLLFKFGEQLKRLKRLLESFL